MNPDDGITNPVRSCWRRCSCTGACVEEGHRALVSVVAAQCGLPGAQQRPLFRPAVEAVVRGAVWHPGRTVKKEGSCKWTPAAVSGITRLQEGGGAGPAALPAGAHHPPPGVFLDTGHAPLPQWWEGMSAEARRGR